MAKTISNKLQNIFAFASEYHISANSFCGNYSFLEVGVRQVFKGGNYCFLVFVNFHNLNSCRMMHWKKGKHVCMYNNSDIIIVHTVSTCFPFFRICT